MSLSVDRVMVEDEGENAGEFKTIYLQMLRHVERLHHLLLNVIKDEFERDSSWDIKAVQALLLYNIGDKELTTGDLRARGYYLGSNVTYNLKKLVAAGYIEQKKSQTDRRSSHIRLTGQGKQVCETIDRLYDRQLLAVGDVGGLALDEMASMNENMQRLERFWQDQIRFKL